MKTFLRAILTASIVMFAASSAWAQGMNVALLDVGFIFQNHPGFKKNMDAMKAEVKKFEQEMKAQQEQIQAASKQIQTYKPGSPEYKRLEEATTKQLAEVKVNMQLKRKEIMESEAKIYMATYKQVASAVSVFASSNNIDLVLRYDREASPGDDMASPQETLKIINRPVIYQKGIDISSAILRQVGGTEVAQRAPAQPQQRRQ